MLHWPLHSLILAIQQGERKMILFDSCLIKRSIYRFFIHGWGSGPDDFLNHDLPPIYREHGDFNYIFVDWSAGAQNPNYITARRNVDELGPLISRYIEWLVEENGVSLSSINIIGHSLGGHAAGLGGKFVTIGRVNAVISLDPAGPLFSLDEPLRRVAVGDADYVEIIHTNGNVLGFGDPIGDTDFYPNGGLTQPGCGSDTAGVCSHMRAPIFFAESINSQVGFWADRCANFAEIENGNCTPQGDRATMGGEPANIGAARGIYFLETDSQEPFALG